MIATQIRATTMIATQIRATTIIATQIRATIQTIAIQIRAIIAKRATIITTTAATTIRATSRMEEITPLNTMA
jgi:hypothetical protein